MNWPDKKYQALRSSCPMKRDLGKCKVAIVSLL